MIAIESDARIKPEVESHPEIHAPEVVLTLARRAGYVGNTAPKVAIFDETNGFSEVTAFIRAARKPGYYRTTFSSCSCPDHVYRSGPGGKLCKHRSQLIRIMDQKDFNEAFAAYQEAKENYVPEPLPDLAAEGDERTDENLRAIYDAEHAGNPYIDRELSFAVWKRKYQRLGAVEALLKARPDHPDYWTLEGEVDELCAALGY